MSNVALVRVIFGTVVLATLVGCGSNASPPLRIELLDPETIGARTTDFVLAVHGTGFTSESRILLGGTELGQPDHSSTQLVALVPGGTAGTTLAGTLEVSVRNSDGSRSNELPLVVSEAPAPVVTLVDSSLCAGNDPMNVTIYGDDFTFDATLEVDGQPTTIGQRTRSSLSFATARKLGRYRFTVRVPPPGGGEVTIGYATFLGCD